MAQEKIEEFSTERLKKRKTFVAVLSVILLVVAVLDGAMLIYDLVRGNGFNFYLFVPALVCLFFAIIMYMGLMRINKELAGRDNK